MLSCYHLQQGCATVDPSLGPRNGLTRWSIACNFVVKVQLPKYKKKKRIKLKICQYCGKEFWGHPIAKYCELHRDVKQREKTKKPTEPLDANNRVFEHEYLEVVEQEFTCELDGCGKTFMVKVFPKQFVYPRYCDEHRNEFKRRNWIRQRQLDQFRALRAATALEKVAEVKAKLTKKPKAKT